MTTLKARKKIVVLMTVAFLLMFMSGYVTKATWTVSDERITDEHGEPLFYENNTPAYKDDIAWTSFIGIIVSASFAMMFIVTLFISVLEWVHCEEPYIFSSKDKKDVLKNIADNYDEEE